MPHHLLLDASLRARHASLQFQTASQFFVEGAPNLEDVMMHPSFDPTKAVDAGLAHLVLNLCSE